MDSKPSKRDTETDIFGFNKPDRRIGRPAAPLGVVARWIFYARAA